MIDRLLILFYLRSRMCSWTIKYPLFFFLHFFFFGLFVCLFVIQLTIDIPGDKQLIMINIIKMEGYTLTKLIQPHTYTYTYTNDLFFFFLVGNKRASLYYNFLCLLTRTAKNKIKKKELSPCTRPHLVVQKQQQQLKKKKIRSSLIFGC